MQLKRWKAPPRRVQQRDEVIKLCFDKESLPNFTPGLKMVYTSEEQPLFVLIKRK